MSNETQLTNSISAEYESHTQREILTQFTAWSAALEVVAAKKEAIRALWQAKQFSEILVTGCGPTYYLSQAVAPLLQQQLGVRARAVPASELLFFPATVVVPDSKPLLLAISRSGHTTETIRATQAATALAHEPQFERMQTLPTLGEQLMTVHHDLAQRLGEDKHIKRFYFLGSGLQYGLASEANLKMKEISLSVSEAFHYNLTAVVVLDGEK